MRRTAAIIAACLAAAGLLAIAAAVVRMRLQDPLAALPRDGLGAIEVVEERRERWQGRTLIHLTLRGSAVGEGRFVVSLPDPIPAQAMPVVVVLGGLRAGSRTVRQVSEAGGDPGPNAFVGYDWPLPPRRLSVREIAARAPEFRGAVLSVPGQVDAFMAWASRQAWADPERVSLLGFSLGAFVAPAAQRLAAERGAAVRWTVIAYGGAPIGAVIAAHPGVKPAWWARVLGAAAGLLLRPVEAAEHLPHVRGRFLVLRAASDGLIASAAADELTRLVPEPRTLLVIEGDHPGVGPDRRKLLESIVAVSKAWLIEEGAIDPSGPAPVRSSGGSGAEPLFPR